MRAIIMMVFNDALTETTMRLEHEVGQVKRLRQIHNLCSIGRLHCDGSRYMCAGGLAA
jgi:hypothetical protein